MCSCWRGTCLLDRPGALVPDPVIFTDGPNAERGLSAAGSPVPLAAARGCKGASALDLTMPTRGGFEARMPAAELAPTPPGAGAGRALTGTLPALETALAEGTAP
jgi:hypothetical protein